MSFRANEARLLLLRFPGSVKRGVRVVDKYRVFRDLSYVERRFLLMGCVVGGVVQVNFCRHFVYGTCLRRQVNGSLLVRLVFYGPADAVFVPRLLVLPTVRDVGVQGEARVAVGVVFVVRILRYVADIFDGDPCHVVRVGGCASVRAAWDELGGNYIARNAALSRGGGLDSLFRLGGGVT